MLAFAIEFTLVVAWFLWAYRRQTRLRDEAKRPPPDQLHLPLDEIIVPDDREVGS